MKKFLRMLFLCVCSCSLSSCDVHYDEYFGNGKLHCINCNGNGKCPWCKGTGKTYGLL